MPRNRKENGIIKDMSILENGTIVSWPDLMRRGLLNHEKQRAEFNEEKAALHIKMGGENDSITSLSGGNQQKVVIGKWLSAEGNFFIFDEPTRGIDVGAKAEIYQLLDRLASEGAAILLISSEMQEVVGLSDRVYVMYEGEIVKELARDDISQEEIVAAAVGGARNKC